MRRVNGEKMLSVLIVEDEYIVGQLIIKLVDWDKLGLELLGVADNGIEALDIILSERPDIVIADIRMPGIDGLEVIERVNKARINTRFLVISGRFCICLNSSTVSRHAAISLQRVYRRDRWYPHQ